MSECKVTAGHGRGDLRWSRADEASQSERV